MKTHMFASQVSRRLENGVTSVIVSVAWAALLAALVAAPWLAPGYIFGTDFAGPRHYLLPVGPSSYAGLQLTLQVATQVFPSDVVGKMFVVAALMAIALSAYWSVPSGFLPRAVASLVYLFNPYVYDRLAYGQVTVLAGYAVLPVVVLATRKLLIQPNVVRALVMGGLLAFIGFVDVHMALIGGVLSALVVVSHLAIEHSNIKRSVQISEGVILAGSFALLTSAFWLVPVLTGEGPEARTLSGIGSGDLVAFSTVPDPHWGLIPNVLGLYGFWAERTGRFVSMKEFVPIWPGVLAFLLLIAGIGAFYTWRLRNDAYGGRPWIAGLGVAAAVAIILEIGVSDPHTAWLVTWLNGVFPPFRGMRDANKWAAILALVYSQLAALGASALMHWAAKLRRSGAFQDVAVSVLVAFLLAMPLYYGNGLLYGMHGQILPSQYPAGWYAADHVLLEDPNPGTAVFLPWHGYMALSFVRNTNPVVASPASMFFSTPTIASEDLEIPGIPPPADDRAQVALRDLVASGARGDWAATLALHNVKYLLLAREGDWRTYRYLDEQTGVFLVADFGSILLYRNILWHASTN